MKKIPRDIGASDLIKIPGQAYGYKLTRQTGSHIRITTENPNQHHITIPNHNPVKLSTLSAILNDVVMHLQKTKQQVIEELF